MLEYVQITPSVRDRTWTRAAEMPSTSTSSRSSSKPAVGSDDSASEISPRSAPAWTAAPSAMAPEMPEKQSK